MQLTISINFESFSNKEYIFVFCIVSRYWNRAGSWNSFSWMVETYRWHSDRHWPLTRYVKLRVTHAAGMPETFFRHRGLVIRHAKRRDARAVMHAWIAYCFLWNWWPGKRSQRMRNPLFYVSGKRLIAAEVSLTSKARYYCTGLSPTGNILASATAGIYLQNFMWWQKMMVMVRIYSQL